MKINLKKTCAVLLAGGIVLTPAPSAKTLNVNTEEVRNIKPHRILAINRAEDEKVLSVSLDYDFDNIQNYLESKIIKNSRNIAFCLYKMSYYFFFFYGKIDLWSLLFMKFKGKEIKACLFDLDGTLLDSCSIWKEVDERFL